MADNPYAEFGGTAVEQVPVTVQRSQKDPYAEFGGAPLATTGPSLLPMTEPVSVQSVANPYAEFGGSAAGQEPSAQPEDQRPGWEFLNKTGDIWHSDENVLEKIWDTANTPLVDLKRQNAKGVEAGVENFASGMTSPLSVVLTAATLGAGGLLENLGLDAGKMAAPEVIAAAKTAGKLAGAGFTAMQLKGIADESPEFVQAIKNGDTDKALEIGTDIVLQGGTALLGAKHVAKDFLGGAEAAKSGPGTQLVGKYMAALKNDDTEAQKINQEFRKSVPNPAQRSAVHFFMEAGGGDTEADPEQVNARLRNWQGMVESAEGIQPDLQRQTVDALKRAQKLNDKEVGAAQNLRQMYDADLNRGAAAGILTTEGRQNYVARARWEKEPAQEEVKNVDLAKDLLGEGSQDHTQRRIYETTIDGILRGETPIKVKGRYIFDAGDLAGDYHRAIGKAIAKKGFVHTALNTIGSDGRPLAVPGGSLTRYDEMEEDENGKKVPTGKTKLMLNGEAIPDHALTRVELRALARSGQLQDMLGQGTLIDQGPRVEEEAGEPNEEPAAEAQAAPAQSAPVAQPNMQRAQEENTPAEPFYLKSERIIDEKMRGPMPADQLRKMLLSNGVKEEELAYTGLDDLLQGNGKVTPEAVKAALEEGKVNVTPREVTHGAGEDKTDELNRLEEAIGSKQDELNGYWQDLLSLAREKKVPYDSVYAIRDGSGTDIERAYASMPEEARNLADQHMKAEDELHKLRSDQEQLYEEDRLRRSTKFGQYTLPGGQNYREMLFTLPTESSFSVVPVEGTNRWRVVDQYGDSKGEFYDRGDAERAAKVDTRQSGSFQSSHWDEPNVLAHVRFNDRTGPNGEKLLHVEEVQSDWHQKGRDQGYKSKDPLAQEPFEAVSDAPFKKTWHEMVLRRMLRYAAEHGYDGVSWTPGEDQAARYSLDKHIDDLRYIPDARKLVAFKNNEPVFSKDDVDPRDLPNYVGKEAAHKLLEAPQETNTKTGVTAHVLRGLDLKVGGSGMRGFYDKIIPDYLNKYAKKFGAKVGETEIQTGVNHPDQAHYEGPTPTVAELRRIAHRADTPVAIGDQLLSVASRMQEGTPFNELMEHWGSEAAARAVGGELVIPRTESQTVSYLPVTDAMRKSVMEEGQPLFNLGKPIHTDRMADGEEMTVSKADDGRSVVHLGPNALNWVLKVFDERALKQGRVLNGMNIYRGGAQWAVKALDHILESSKDDSYFQKAGHAADVTKLRDTIQKALDTSDKRGVTFVAHPEVLGKDYEPIKGEEFNHGDQRMMTGDDDELIKSHLDEDAFRELANQIPKPINKYLKGFGYRGEAVRVVEASAKLMSGQLEEMGVKEKDAIPFLGRYFDALTKKWGPDALQHLKSAVGVAARLRDERIAQYAERERVSDTGTSPEVSGSVPERGGSRNQSGPPGAEGEGQVRGGPDRQEAGELGGSERPAQDRAPDEVEEKEYKPGDTLPSPVSTPAAPKIEDTLAKLPDHIQAAIRNLTEKVKEHQDLVANATDEDKEDVERSDFALQDMRDEIEDSIEQIKRLPKGVRKAALEHLKQLAPYEDEKALEGYYRGRYRYNTEGYDNSIRHRYTYKAVYGGSDDVGLKAPIAFHPEVAKQAKLILNPEKSWFQKNPVTSKILGISTQAKQSLLSLSGFHWVQEGLRGLESGINPVKPLLDMLHGTGGWDMHDPEQLRLVQSGGIQPGLQSGADSFAEGLKGHGPISKIPVAGKVIDTVNNALFGPNGYIDRLKLNAALHFAERLKETNPKLDEMSRYKAAGELANQRFGGLNYLQMGRSPMAQDILRLTLLAPDWMESNLRDALSTVGPFGKISRFDLARIALYNFAVAQTLNLLNTGKMHLDTPFGVQSQDGKKVFSVRTMPQDIYHALTQPMDYASNRLNPLLSRTAVEAITGRDKQGHLRNVGDQIKDLVSNVTPIPLQGVVNTMIGNEHLGQDAKDYVRSAAGLTTKALHTPAEALAYKLASVNSSSANLPSDQAAHFRRIVGYEDRLRSGDQKATQDMMAALHSGKIAPADVKQIMKASKDTRLQAVVNRLPMEQAIDVWNLATNEERKQMFPIMAKKMAQFRKTEAQKLTPAEQVRMNLKLAKVFNDVATVFHPGA